MTVREFAKSKGFDIVGKLIYKGVDDYGYKMWEDEACNAYYKKNKEYCIVTNDGGVI